VVEGLLRRSTIMSVKRPKISCFSSQLPYTRHNVLRKILSLQALVLKMMNFKQ
jgi:hypothetical protein